MVTEGRVHESRIARSLRFKPGAIVVFDRGYKDKRIEQDKLAITIRHRILAAVLAKVAMPRNERAAAKWRNIVASRNTSWASMQGAAVYEKVT